MWHVVFLTRPAWNGQYSKEVCKKKNTRYNKTSLTLNYITYVVEVGKSCISRYLCDIIHLDSSLQGVEINIKENGYQFH